MEKIKDVKDLKPIVEKTIKILYGRKVTDIKIRLATPHPTYADIEETKSWHVQVEFNNTEKSYGVSLTVQASDGRVTETREIWSHRLSKK